jgi:hypothetical protein
MAARFDVTVANQGHGFFVIQGNTRAGREWVDARVYDAANGVAYTDDSRLAEYIYEGALREGMRARAIHAEGRRRAS